MKFVLKNLIVLNIVLIWHDFAEFRSNGRTSRKTSDKSAKGVKPIGDTIYWNYPNIRTTESVNELSFGSVPSSFAILVNFGVDGRRRMLFSSSAEDHNCKDNEIWDPFNKQCRRLYCSADFTLVDFTCVEKNNETTRDEDITQPMVSFLDSNSQFVNISLGFSLPEPVLNIDDWISSQNASFEKEFITQLAETFPAISAQSILNLSLIDSIIDNHFVVNFNLMESNDSISESHHNDAILQVLSTTVSQRGLSFRLYDHKVIAISIHTTISKLKNFCSGDSDMPIWYWNSEFAMSHQGNSTYLDVRETGKRYRPGQYLGNILYVQKIQMSKALEPNKVNVSSNAVVCETQTLINESCTRILLNRSEYEWVDNTTDGHTLLKMKLSEQTYDRYELAPNGTVYVCYQYNDTNQYIQDFVEDILSTVLIGVSIFALTCVVVTYSLFRSLRSTLNGFNTINLAICIEMMQILFLWSPHVMDCQLTAIALHFLLLLTMSWSRFAYSTFYSSAQLIFPYHSVIAFDMYRTFGSSTIRLRLKNGWKTKLIYWSSAHTLAAVVVITAIIFDEIDSVISPSYGGLEDTSGCWIRNPLAAFVFFGVPLMINISINLILYLMTVCRVKTDLKSCDHLRKVTRIPSDSSETSNSSSNSFWSTTSTSSLTQRQLRNNSMAIYCRLAALMGFTWITALIIAIIPQTLETLLTVLSYIFVILNTSQGIVLFIAFLCNKRVAKLWLKLFQIKV